MNYLIDGHNLIPKVSGLDLKMADDELLLIELLLGFCNQNQHNVEVYFDNSPPGQPDTRHFGRVRATFIRQNQSADHAILSRLHKLGRSAGNWTVVSSDRQVLAAARQMHAQVLKSEKFASLLTTYPDRSIAQDNERNTSHVSQAEVDEWLELFEERERRNHIKNIRQS